MGQSHRVLLALLFSLLAQACAGERHVLRLSQVSPRLSPFEGSPYDALATGPVSYTVIGEPDYDKFFQEAAAVHGAMLFALRSVERLETIAEGSANPTPLDYTITLTLLTDTLPRTQQRAMYLQKEAMRLRGRIFGDFFWKFYKIPKVRRALNETRENLESTKALVPQLLGRLMNLHRRIKLNKGLEKSL